MDSSEAATRHRNCLPSQGRHPCSPTGGETVQPRPDTAKTDRGQRHELWIQTKDEAECIRMTRMDLSSARSYGERRWVPDRRRLVAPGRMPFGGTYRGRRDGAVAGIAGLRSLRPIALWPAVRRLTGFQGGSFRKAPKNLPYCTHTLWGGRSAASRRLASTFPPRVYRPVVMVSRGRGPTPFPGTARAKALPQWSGAPSCECPPQECQRTSGGPG